MRIDLFDCTLRDGGSVRGGGVSTVVTKGVAEGLVANGVKHIEIGNTYSMGRNGLAKCVPGTPSDDQYIEAVDHLLKQAHFGMFFNPKFGGDADLEKAAARGLAFIRIGANVGEVEPARHSVKKAREVGLETRFSLMKSWAATPAALAEDARRVEDMGVNIVHMMDSTGSFLPDELSRSCEAVQKAITIPLAFHGHNNLGLSIGNALAAYKAGVRIFDCSVCGFARSAGNAPTEMLAVIFERMGIETGLNVFGLLAFIEQSGADLLGAANYVPPLDVVFGMAGFHSSFTKVAREAAEAHNVSLHKLIVEASNIERINPSAELFTEIAQKL